MRAVGILATGSHVPETVRTNAEIERRLGLEPGWIERRSGIRERRVASPGEATSDLATGAALAALEASSTTPEEIDLILLATTTPDLPISSTACIVQGNIGARRAAAIDVNAACAGFVYALTMAAAMLRGREVGRALVIGAEVVTPLIDPAERKTAVLFGDGAGAAVLGGVPDGYGLLGSDLRTDGSQWRLAHVPAGGSREPASEQTLAGGRHFVKMDARGVADFMLEHVPEGILAATSAGGLALDEVDLLIPHQANGVLVRDCLGRLGLDPGRAHWTVERYGNTGGASVPITLDDAVASGRVTDGSRVVLFGMGAGMAWGGAALRWWGG